MTESENAKRFDLEDRTLEFARDVRCFLKSLPRGIANDEDGRQLVRPSGSVGANYIEANEALSRKDFVMRIKICRKEAKESAFWLKLIALDRNSDVQSGQKERLIQEATELTKIFGAILRKSD